MAISDEDLAKALYENFTGMTTTWVPLNRHTKEEWLSVARKARKLLIPDRGMTQPKSDSGPLQPGDIVRVCGLVESDGAGDLHVAFYSSTGRGSYLLVEDITSRDIVLIERPAPPEPDWQPGDLAESESKCRYVFVPAGQKYKDKPWVGLNSGMRAARNEIPGTLTPCDIVPRKSEKKKVIET